MTREEKIVLLIDELEDIRCNNFDADTDEDKTLKEVVSAIKTLGQEPLTDTEQRIFLAAMGREEKICREVDEKYPYKEPYEYSLVSVCRSIERKVKKALWE